MHFPSKLDENIELLAKNNRFSEIEKGTLLLHHLSVHDEYAVDDRNFVKKAVNWALRQIGKRNSYLLALALECAYELQKMDSKAACWVANDALREFRAKYASREEK